MSSIAIHREIKGTAGGHATPRERTALDGYTGTSEVARLAAELFLCDRELGLADQKLLTEALGLDVPPRAPARPPGPQRRADEFRHSIRRRQ